MWVVFSQPQLLLRIVFINETLPSSLFSSLLAGTQGIKEQNNLDRSKLGKNCISLEFSWQAFRPALWIEIVLRSDGQNRNRLFAYKGFHSVHISLYLYPSDKLVKLVTVSFFHAGVGSFLLYSVHEGIRGIPLDPNDKSDALVPVSGTSLAVGIDFHAGRWQIPAMDKGTAL